MAKIPFRVARAALVLAVLLTIWHFVRPHLRAKLPGPDDATRVHLAQTKILRDTWGVPHVFGKTDADAAFGLAYAHAEDDFPTIQTVIAASQGKLGYLLWSKKALVFDYYTNLVRSEEKARAAYEALDPKTRALVEGYARGLNYYAYKHPSESDPRVFPVAGVNVVAGFVHKLSIMVGVPGALEALGKGSGGGKPKHRGELLGHADLAEDPRLSPREYPGSNAHAVHRTRSSDDVTRLNVNSHQPWEGPVAWYEVQVVSEEGWNMTGGTFPGAPIILHGHNEVLGWAHTVNAPDLLDVFELETDPKREGEYRLDGTWKKFETKEAVLTFDTGLFDVPVKQKVRWSEHGPVLDFNGVSYAVRYAAIDRGAFAVEQWYRMNKATSLETWREAMREQGIPMFHTVYADRDNVDYVYNALLPIRKDGFDYARILPGNESAAIFHGYLPFDALPRVRNPPSGFVQGCNSTPFSATVGEGNPDPNAFAASFGVERTVTNRTRRSLALLAGTQPIDAAAFEKMKWDRNYDRESEIFKLAVDPLVKTFAPQTEDETKALALVRSWNGSTSETSVEATIPVIMLKSLSAATRDPTDPNLSDPAAAFRDAIAFLKAGFGRVDVALGDVQRLRRGKVDLPLGGGPDVMNAVYTKRENGHLVGNQGDSYVLMVEFGPDKTTSRSIHQYGASCRPESPHFADQAPLFAARKLKQVWRTREEIRAHLEREYTPGE